MSAAEEDDDIDEYREWQQDRIIKAKEVINSDDYLSLPSKFDMNEYQIIEEFCCSVKNDKIRESLLDKIRGRGAFSRFKDAIRVNGIEEEWYRLVIIFRNEMRDQSGIRPCRVRNP
jgi:hypothetical protein